MMRSLVPIGLLALAGCVTVKAPAESPPTSPDASPDCNAAAAQRLVGQTASSETGARARSLTGARTLRWGPPNAMWTMDYRPDRVNVRYDSSMRITEITCG